MTKISVLFTMKNSIYESLEVDCWGKERNALNWPGGNPIIAHPPCRAWGRLRGLAKPVPGEKELAIWAVHQIRKYGGVLEHPETSLLWKEMNLPKGREIDEYGGFTLSVDQFWFGHLARKRTWLYIVGCGPLDIPTYPVCFDAITHTISPSMKRGRPHFTPKPQVSKADRERTPIEFAKWLIDVASRCNSIKTRVQC